MSSSHRKHHRRWTWERITVSLRNLCTEIAHLGNNAYVDGSHYWNSVTKDYSNHNLGDDLSFPLLKWLLGKPVLPIRYTIGPRTCERLLCIGSIIEAHSNPNAIVWGAGLIRPPHKKIMLKKVYAVRGPETRRELLQLGIDCPPVYGDPAILMPRLYTPAGIEKKHKIGLIPHLSDLAHPFVAEWKRQNRPILDLAHYGTWQAFVDQLCSCEAILSSSLHGLILADAYGIPSRRLCLSEEIIGGDFKYHDYYGSYREDIPPCLTGDTLLSENEYLRLAKETWQPLPDSLGEKLLQAFPWKRQTSPT